MQLCGNDRKCVVRMLQSQILTVGSPRELWAIYSSVDLRHERSKLILSSPLSTTQAARTADGKGVLGATIFVRTDCSNNQRLPLDQQDPAYQHEGVAAPQSVYDAFIANVSSEICPTEFDCIFRPP